MATLDTFSNDDPTKNAITKGQLTIPVLANAALPQQDDPQPPNEQHYHFKMYKPYNCLTQFVYTTGNHSCGPKQRKRNKVKLLGDVYKEFPPGVMAIGRLDQDSEGLLLLTTNGRMSNQITRPLPGQTTTTNNHGEENNEKESNPDASMGTEKEYWVQVKGVITEQAIKRLQKGVEIIISTSTTALEEDNIQNHKKENRRTTCKSTYTTRPCKVQKLKTHEIIEPPQTKPSSIDPIGDGHPRQPRKKKRKMIQCNTCGIVGHRAAECPNSSGHHPKVSSAPIVHRVPDGIPLPGRIILDESCHGPSSWISMTVTEGKFRQVRKMTSAVGFPTLRLVRVRIGSIHLDGMDVGEVRPLDIGCLWNT